MNLKSSLIIQLIFLSAIIQFYSCQSQPNKDKIKHTNIPDINDVGSDNLSDTIAGINAPFKMDAILPPEIPDETIIIKRSELKNHKEVTKIIQHKIDSVSNAGGGIIVIDSGDWNSGRLILKNNINLHLNKGTNIHFSGKLEDYRPAVFTRVEGIEVMSLGACIYANNATNIAITGKGKLIGPADGPVRTQFLKDKVIEDAVPLDKPVKMRVYEGYNHSFIFSPMFISPINCKNVLIEGVSLENTAFWNIVPIYCENVIIRGITVNSVGIQRGDGIDIESSKNVLIEYCTLSCGDDCFTMKAGRGLDGIRVNKPTENVVVRYCLAKEGHGGITCGSETAGMIKNLYVHDCVFENTGVGIRFKTRRPRGGGGENLYYNRIRMNLRNTAIKWDMLGGVSSVGALANRLPERPINNLTPKYENIYIQDLIVENSTHFLKIYGIPESPVKNLTINNSTINCSNLILAHDVKGMKLDNITVNSTDSIIDLTDCKNITFNKVEFEIPSTQLYIKKQGEKCDSIQFINCLPTHIEL